jgi:hypothetical protein
VYGGFSSTGNVIINWTVAAPPPPKCRCGCDVAPTVRWLDGTLWAQQCAENEQRRRLIANAEQWITAAFLAVDSPRRSSIYRALAAVFHPDGKPDVDPALMVALNAVRDRLVR